MKPQEKAKELVKKYDETLTYLESKSKAKQCALIAVNEIIKEIAYYDQAVYWQEVKQEIEKL